MIVYFSPKHRTNKTNLNTKEYFYNNVLSPHQSAQKHKKKSSGWIKVTGRKYNQVFYMWLFLITALQQVFYMWLFLITALQQGIIATSEYISEWHTGTENCSVNNKHKGNGKRTQVEIIAYYMWVIFHKKAQSAPGSVPHIVQHRKLFKTGVHLCGQTLASPLLDPLK